MSTAATRPRTVTQAADELALSPHTLRRWISTRRIAHVRLGRAVRIEVDEINRLLGEGRIPVRRRSAK